MDTNNEVLGLAGAALTAEQRAKHLDLVGRLMLAGRHPEGVLAMEAASCIQSLLAAHPDHSENDSPAGYAEELPGTNKGFTMVVFDGATVPVGTPVYTHQTQVIANGTAFTDAEVTLLGSIKKFHTHDFGRGPELHADAIADAYKRGCASSVEVRTMDDAVSERALEIVGEVLDAKELMHSHGCKQAPFAEMFAEFVAMHATAAQADGTLLTAAQRQSVVSALAASLPRTAEGYKQSVKDAMSQLPDGRFFVYDPNAGHVDFYDSDAERNEAHKDAISEYRRDALSDGEWSRDVESVVSGIVTHKTVATDVAGEACDYEPR